MNKMRRNIFALFVSLILINILFSSSAYAKNIEITNGGKVSIELINSDSNFSNTLSLISPSVSIVSNGCNIDDAEVLLGVKLLSENITRHGCRVDLDADSSTPGIQAFPAGTIFEFNMLARIGPNTTHIWSSDQLKNSDNFDHVNIIQLHSPDDIYQLGWEDSSGGGDQDFNELIVVIRVDKDTDGDGFWDDWEQYGIDTDGDGAVELDLPALGANPNHKDIFLEIDYMDCSVPGGDCIEGDTHSHKPDNAALQEVIDAFKNSPVTNPDGVKGINLHIDLSNSIPHQNYLNYYGKFKEMVIGKFSDVKLNPNNFGPNNPRRFAYHYGLFTHQVGPGITTSGVAEMGGNDLIISLGTWTNTPNPWNPNPIREQSAVLMHELGHNLNLSHGGGDEINCKPNYLSVMNYMFQHGLNDTNSPTKSFIDYSREELNPLDESNLDEIKGINDGTLETKWADSLSNIKKGSGSGPLDWTGDDFDKNGIFDDDQDVAVDINAYPKPGCGKNSYGEKVSSPGQIIEGFDDWKNLKYDFQNSVDFQDGAHLEIEDKEMDYDTYLQMIDESPIADPGGPYSGNEGTSINMDASRSSDPDDSIQSYQWDFGDGSIGSGKTVSHIYNDNGLYTVSLTVRDSLGVANTKLTTANIANTEPTVGPITATLYPQPVGTTISISSPFTDEEADTHTAIIDWDDGTSTTGIITETEGSGSVSDSHIYNTPGVYSIKLSIIDKDSGIGTAEYHYVIIYDPNGGYVTGGGWINSPEKAYPAEPTMIGRANFGFVSKYQKGTSPTGEIEFQFKVGNLNFHSVNYEWLVVAGAKAQFKGSGAINNTGDYGFILTAIDGQINGGGGSDKFRIKIWDKNNADTVIYDNQLGATDTATPTTVIQGGSIVIHS